MSLKGSTTRADYIEWNTAVNLVHKLYRDRDYRMSLLIGCGIFFGLRISDLLQLSWDMLLNGDSSLSQSRKRASVVPLESTEIFRNTSAPDTRL